MLNKEQLYLKWYRDYHNTIAYARQEGIEEGKKEGLEKWRKEYKIETIKASLKLGLSLEEISIITRLPIEDVQKIIREQGLKIN